MLVACSWLFLLGMLASQLVFIGFESPSQFAEETRKADRTVPQAIVWSIIACGVLGGGLVLVLLFCIQVRPTTLNSPSITLHGLIISWRLTQVASCPQQHQDSEIHFPL